MDTKKNIATMSLVLFCAGCTAGKSISSASDIVDDGKRNTVVMTYDIKLYTTNRHPTVKKTDLHFRCPKNATGFGPSCFTIRAPFLGNKPVDGYTLNAFEQSGTKVFQMKYGDHLLQSIRHSVVIDRVPKLVCTTSKKTKKRTCRNKMEDVRDQHSASIPDPIAVIVSAGTGCHAGHLELTMVDEAIVGFTFTNDEPLSAEALTDLSPDMVAGVMAHVDKPCY